MEPKFQSSFIPKGAATAGAASAGLSAPRRRQRDLFSFLSGALFTLSLLLALGVFGYKFFLDYRITAMRGELEAARAALEPETVEELINLNSRIVSAETLIARHRIISPIFRYLEVSTPRTLRYTDFAFDASPKGLMLTLRGEARGYSALAAAAETLKRSEAYFQNVSFSNLELDSKGNVLFSLELAVEPSVLSYVKSVSSLPRESQPVSTSTAATSSAATSSPRR